MAVAMASIVSTQLQSGKAPIPACPQDNMLRATFLKDLQESLFGPSRIAPLKEIAYIIGWSLYMPVTWLT